MKQNWFKKAGWIYLPVHALGMLVTLAAIAFMVMASIAIFKNGPSAGNREYEIIVYGSCIAFGWKWIAEKTSEK